jgi:hypothetical protein
MKLHEITNPEINKIKRLLKQYNIKNYTIRPDGLVDVDGEVDLSEQRFTTIPIQFGIVNGWFSCSRCPQLTSLQGAPQTVNRGFCCYDCPQLTSLEHAPHTVNRDFYCDGDPHLKILRVFFIKGLQYVFTGDDKLNNIIMKYYQQDGQGDIIAAQDEMIDAGYGKIARL